MKLKASSMFQKKKKQIKYGGKNGKDFKCTTTGSGDIRRIDLAVY